MVGRLGVLTANAAARADQEAGKQDDAHVPTRLLQMAEDHAEDILSKAEDAGVEFHVKKVRLYFTVLVSKAIIFTLTYGLSNKDLKRADLKIGLIRQTARV